jgi:hypothetical protein
MLRRQRMQRRMSQGVDVCQAKSSNLLAIGELSISSR